MLGGVFISYRREDSGGFAGRIYDRLTNRLGRERIFFDVDNIPPGMDFVDVLTERVGACGVLIAVIGKNWISSADEDNRRRLDDPNDFVRIEIEAALARGVWVIPVLVDGAAMPKPEELPDSLKKLRRRQAIEISHSRFNSPARSRCSMRGFASAKQPKPSALHAKNGRSGKLPKRRKRRSTRDDWPRQRDGGRTRNGAPPRRSRPPGKAPQTSPAAGSRPRGRACCDYSRATRGRTSPKRGGLRRTCTVPGLSPGWMTCGNLPDSGTKKFRRVSGLLICSYRFCLKRHKKEGRIASSAGSGRLPAPRSVRFFRCA